MRVVRRREGMNSHGEARWRRERESIRGVEGEVFWWKRVVMKGGREPSLLGGRWGSVCIGV